MANTQTKKLVMLSVLSAITLVLQLLGSFIKFGPFSISLVLVPIVVGAAICGKFSGAWLGFVFGLSVLISGDASAFLAVSPIGTILTVLLKGILCGIAAEFCYRSVAKLSPVIATFVSAIVCPVVNTGIFLIGCKLFFMELISQWAAALGFENVGAYMILGLVGGNFLFEMAANLVLSPIIVRLVKISDK